MPLRLLHILVAILVFVSAGFYSMPVVAQGFMVKPVLIETAVSPGQPLQIPLEIRNTSSDGPRLLEISLAELSQHANGAWNFRPLDDAVLNGAQSSLPWTSIDRTEVEIAPLEPAEVTIQLDPPRDARGAYFAALLVETPAPPEGTPGVSIRARFLIPIIIEIQGRIVRQNVQLDDVVMTYENAEGRDPTTTLHMRIENAGQTFSQVKGTLRVERRSGESWRLVTRFDTRERPIIPGMILELGRDLERRLPSGEYRLSADVTVDGRRLPPLEKEIEFEGDPAISSVAYDTELRLTPDIVRMDVVPGATRTTILNIENPGEAPVSVRIGPATPRGLTGVRMGELIGTELSAELWTSVRPDSFTLRGGGRQNVRVVSNLPADAGEHANYYADLNLSGTYGDGQSAGYQTSIIHLQNSGVERVLGGSIKQLSLSQGDGDIYSVQATFVNTGNTHVEPLARVYIRNPQGRTVTSINLSSEGGILLPLGKRIFGGDIDFSDIEPGVYAMQAQMDLGDAQTVSSQQVIRVERGESEDGDGDAIVHVTILDADELSVTGEVKGG